MEKNVEMLSLADALRDGASLEDIRKSFEAALQNAQSEVAAEKKKAQEAKACENCGDCNELDLDVCREEMIYAVLDYLTALGLIPEDMEIEDDDIDHLIDMIKEVEEEYKAKISFMKMLSAMAKMEADKKEKVSEKKVVEKSSADYVIAQFLKGLR
jgi:predicted molibdopterin-dependent oxidoreductase YjgC